MVTWAPPFLCSHTWLVQVEPINLFVGKGLYWTEGNETKICRQRAFRAEQFRAGAGGWDRFYCTAGINLEIKEDNNKKKISLPTLSCPEYHTSESPVLLQLWVLRALLTGTPRQGQKNLCIEKSRDWSSRRQSQKGESWNSQPVLNTVLASQGIRDPFIWSQIMSQDYRFRLPHITYLYLETFG